MVMGCSCLGNSFDFLDGLNFYGVRKFSMARAVRADWYN